METLVLPVRKGCQETLDLPDQVDQLGLQDRLVRKDRLDFLVNQDSLDSREHQVCGTEPVNRCIVLGRFWHVLWRLSKNDYCIIMYKYFYLAYAREVKKVLQISYGLILLLLNFLLGTLFLTTIFEAVGSVIISEAPD